MLVAHQQDYDTHAIIGGSDVIEFGVAQTAEFFEVLSSTLYSDKPLAVVREVICNAWDAHIAAGKQDTPIQVTIDDTKMVIRDFGKGIAHHMMQPIYCVYGNSTKTNDGNQTGGFGLGSKSPFAYTNHFTVISLHEGFRTVYAISRGSAKTNGKPDCRVMVKVPTTESGLEVTIPLKQASDGAMFTEILRNLVRLGEMNVEFNGVKLSTMPISKAKEGFYFTKTIFSKNQERIYVRYGNVVYPIPTHEDYEFQYNEITRFMEDLPGSRRGHGVWRVIFQAPANKISVTPSRESLSMTDTTIGTIKELFKSLPTIGSKPFIEISQNMVKESIDKAWSELKQYRMLEFNSLFSDPYNVANYVTELTSYKDSVESILKNSYPSVWEFKTNDITKRVRTLIDSGVTNRHVLALFLKELKQTTSEHFRQVSKDQWSLFISRHITGALAKKMLKSDLVDVKNLFVVTTPTGWSSKGPVYTPIGKFSGEFHHVGELLKNTIVLTHSRISVTDHLGNNPAVKHFYGKTATQLVYVAPRNKSSGGNALEFFNKIGMNVIDHIGYIDSLGPAVSIPKSVFVEPKKPKIVGIPSMKNLLDKNQNFVVRGHLVENPERIENPEFVFQPHNLSGASYNHEFFKFKDRGVADRICKQFGHLGGVVVNSKQLESYIKKGSKDGYVWLGERLLEEFQTNARLLKYISFRLAPWESTNGTLGTVKKLFKVSENSPAIKQELKFPDGLTRDDHDFLQMWSSIRPPEAGSYRYNHPPESMNDSIKAIQKIIDDQGIDPQLTVVQDIVTNSELFRLIDFDEMSSILSQKNVTPKQRDNVETLLLLALQG